MAEGFDVESATKMKNLCSNYAGDAAAGTLRCLRRLGFGLVTAVLLPLLPACVQPGPATPASDSLNEQQQLAPDIEAIGDATFSGIYDHPITFSNGRWEGEPFVPGGASRPTAALAKDLYLSGDLDGDGQDEAIVILGENSGGSGSFSYIAVVGWRDGGIENVGTALIGDRVQIRDAGFDGQHIVLQVVQQGPKDAECCPSQKATRTWFMTPNGLQEGGVVIDGTLSIGDLDGKSWRLLELRRDEPVLKSAPVTLVFDGSRLSGQGPCNRYFAGAEPGDYPGSIIIGPVGSTRMACSAGKMEFEQQYFQALSGVNRFSFSVGRLALTWVHEDEWNTMIFELVSHAASPTMLATAWLTLHTSSIIAEGFLQVLHDDFDVTIGQAHVAPFGRHRHG